MTKESVKYYLTLPQVNDFLDDKIQNLFVALPRRYGKSSLAIEIDYNIRKKYSYPQIYFFTKSNKKLDNRQLDNSNILIIDNASKVSVDEWFQIIQWIRQKGNKLFAIDTLSSDDNAFSVYIDKGFDDTLKITAKDYSPPHLYEELPQFAKFFYSFHEEQLFNEIGKSYLHKAGIIDENGIRSIEKNS